MRLPLETSRAWSSEGARHGVPSESLPVTVALFFTYGVSLATWHAAGLLRRELALYHQLARLGVRTVFVTYGGKEEHAFQKELGDIQIVPLYEFVPKARGRRLCYLQSLSLFRQVRGRLRHVDIVKTNQMWGGWVALQSARTLGARLVVRCGVERYKNALAERTSAGKLAVIKRVCGHIYRGAEAIILPSNEIADFVVTTFGIDRARIRILPNYVDCEQFRPLPRQKNGRLLFLGRLDPAKNLFSIIDAVAIGGYELDIVGDGPLRRELESQIARRQAKVRLLGTIPHEDLPELINRYEAFVFPSFYEGQPKAFLEVMSCGLPVIGSTADSFGELIVDGDNGLRCDTSSASIAQAIGRLMSDGRLRQRLGERATAFVRGYCDVADIAVREHALYQELVA